MEIHDKGRSAMLMAMILSGTIGIVVVFSGLIPEQVVFWRCLIGLPVLAFALRGTSLPVLTRRQWLLVLLSGVLLVANWLLIFSSYRTLSVGMATVIYNTQPLFLVLLGTLLLKETLSRAGWGWLLAAFAGMLLVVAADGGKSGGDISLQGVAAALGAAFCYALMAILTRYLIGVPPTFLALVQISAGVIILLPFSLSAPQISAPQWGWLLVLGIVHTGIMYQLLLFALRSLTPATAASFSFIYPLIAVALDALLLQHSFTAAQLAGGVLILLSAAGINLRWGEKRAGMVRE